jgi:hypothetical protein
MNETQRLVVESLALAALVIWAAVVVGRVRGTRATRVAGVVIGSFALVCALGHVGSDASTLRQDARFRVGARAGVDHCFVETGSRSEIPFIDWVHSRLPEHAVYQLDDVAPRPDAWCLTLVLLPALPAGPGDNRPRWEVDFGGLSPSLEARVKRHDRSVHVFAPGFALAPLDAGAVPGAG